MSRLDDLRGMRDFIDSEIETLLAAEVVAIRHEDSVRRVCELYAVPVESVLLGVRSHDVTRARHAMAWLLHQQGMTLRDIARPLGYAGPASVLKGIERVESDVAMRALLRGLQVVA